LGPTSQSPAHNSKRYERGSSISSVVVLPQTHDGPNRSGEQGLGRAAAMVAGAPAADGYRLAVSYRLQARGMQGAGEGSSWRSSSPAQGAAWMGSGSPASTPAEGRARAPGGYGYGHARATTCRGTVQGDGGVPGCCGWGATRAWSRAAMAAKFWSFGLLGFGQKQRGWES
jgi:hypothetical protein